MAHGSTYLAGQSESSQSRSRCFLQGKNGRQRGPVQEKRPRSTNKSQTQLIFNLIYNPILPLVKASIIILLIKVAWVVDPIKRVLYVIFAFNAAASVGPWVCLIFLCPPLTGQNAEAKHKTTVFNGLKCLNSWHHGREPFLPADLASRLEPIKRQPKSPALPSGKSLYWFPPRSRLTGCTNVSAVQPRPHRAALHDLRSLEVHCCNRVHPKHDSF